ncbi:hypothetical protein K438DRAFT_2056739 [Mycena galopus ATCC 62051]|nr:hypothetical protein K438DRAFT_2056739 [Mycena galopus ATCC 62051]
MDFNFTERLTPGPAPRTRDTWYYSRDMGDDLQDLDIPAGIKGEILATAYEYTRCIIPYCTNLERRRAFMRVIVLTIVAEFKGTMVDVLAGDNLLGYSVQDLLDTLFVGSPAREDMGRELRCCLLIMAEKSSSRRDGELFRRYANCLADSPKQWFRMRDCDALARFSLMAALACNDALEVCFSEEQLQVLCEITLTMYDAVAIYKHRSEGEVCSTFSYVPEDLRVAAFRQCREVLWALDAAWADRPMMPILNLLRFLGGPIHMLMRRYRFVDEDLRIGVSETEEYRIDANKVKDVGEDSVHHYKDVLAASEKVLFPGLAHTLETAGDGNCDTCIHRSSYGAEDTHCFGGVQLCDDCRASWRQWIESFPHRAAKVLTVFPELEDMYARGIPATSEFQSTIMPRMRGLMAAPGIMI